MNTIASSFGCLSKKVGDLHRFMLSRNADTPALAALLRETAPTLSAATSTSTSTSSTTSSTADASSDGIKALATRIPVNRSLRMLAVALAMAHYLYGDSTAVVAFVVQPGERNIADQRALEVRPLSRPQSRPLSSHSALEVRNGVCFHGCTALPI